MNQLEFSLKIDPLTCNHESCFYSLSEVPGGDYCEDCECFIFRSICYQEEPKNLGYITATWAWHYQDQKPWTNDI